MVRNTMYTQQEFEDLFNSLYGDKFSVTSKYTGRKNKIRICCKRCGLEFERTAGNLGRGTLSCPKCDRSKGGGGTMNPIVGVNDMWTINPDAAKCLKDHADGYKYMWNTHQELSFICPTCGTEYKKRPADMFGKNGNFRCCYCSDGFSYPEKFIHSMLEQCGVNYIYQFSSKNANWCENYRYDFCIPSLNIIIEANGIQHYKDNRTFGISLQDQQYIDESKRSLALQNHMLYVEIDCSISSLEYIRENILASKLSSLLDLSNINWEQCGLFASSSIMKIVCSEWKNQYDDILLISNKYHITKETVLKYLKEGNVIGLCDFNFEEYQQYRKQLHYKKVSEAHKYSIKCVETGEIYSSVSDVKIKLGIRINENAIDDPTTSSRGYHWIRLYSNQFGESA